MDEVFQTMREPCMDAWVMCCRTCGYDEEKLCRPFGLPVVRYGRYYQIWYCLEHSEQKKERAVYKGWLIENTKPDFEVG